VGLAVGLPLILAGCVLATRRSARAVADSRAQAVDAPVP
jgi:hypothetical protein